MKPIWQILSHTPTYVYFIFTYLLIIGIKSSRERWVSLYKAFVVFFIFLYFSVFSIAKLTLEVPFVVLFAIVFASCFYLSWQKTANSTIRIDRHKKQLLVPGSWLTMVLVLSLFSAKYYLGYQNAQDPRYFLTHEAKVITLLSSGFSLGMILGRLTNYLYRFRIDEHSTNMES